MSIPTANAPKPSVTIRRATLSDGPAIRTIGSTTFHASFAHSMPASDMSAYLKAAFAESAIAAELSDTGRYTFYVAEVEGHVVGFVQMKLGTTETCLPADVMTCELQRLYVADGMFGGGIGGKLIETGVEWARGYIEGVRKERGLGGDGNGEVGRAAVWLSVWGENVKARRFYERAGFQAIGERDFVSGKTVQTDIIVIKYL